MKSEDEGDENLQDAKSLDIKKEDMDNKDMKAIERSSSRYTVKAERSLHLIPSLDFDEVTHMLCETAKFRESKKLSQRQSSDFSCKHLFKMCMYNLLHTCSKVEVHYEKPFQYMYANIIPDCMFTCLVMLRA